MLKRRQDGRPKFPFFSKIDQKIKLFRSLVQDASWKPPRTSQKPSKSLPRAVPGPSRGTLPRFCLFLTFPGPRKSSQNRCRNAFKISFILEALGIPSPSPVTTGIRGMRFWCWGYVNMFGFLYVLVLARASMMELS